MWRCKKCGEEMIKVGLQEHFYNLGKDGKAINCFGKHTEYYYICLDGKEKIHDKKLEEIADWKDEFTERETSNEYCPVCPHTTCSKYEGSEKEE